MFTKERLKSDFAALGLKPTDTVFVHSSMKAVAPVEGGAETVLDAFIEYFADGLVLFPTHTWEWFREKGSFDARGDKSCVGLLGNLALQRPNAYRTCHASHSCVAFGKDAEAFSHVDDNVSTPLPRNGSMGQLIDRHGIILMMGSSPKKNTFLHCVEEILGVPDRIEQTGTECDLTAWDGTRQRKTVRGHHCSLGEVSHNYDRAVPILMKSGAMWTGMIGNALTFAERADKVFETMTPVLTENPDFFLNEPEA